MRLIFIGPQGSGKGTQAKVISKELGLCHISTGDMLREVVAGKHDVLEEVRHRLKGMISKGELVPDELIFAILKKRIEQEDCRGGFILDGFPRDLRQAKMLKDMVHIDKVIEIFISDKEAIRRVLGRRNCENCGVIYNVATSPRPLVEGVCDRCGGRLKKRGDDNKEALGKRLNIYHKHTEEIFKMFDFVGIDGERSIESVTKDILEQLS